MEPNNKFELMERIAASFRPSAPIDSRAFAGRDSQIARVINACVQRGQHVVIFGERGAGKTSLANTLGQMLRTKFVTPACGSINCDETTTFASLWRAMLSEIPITKNASVIGFKNGADREQGTFAQLLPETVTPHSVRAVLQRHGKFLFIIDEIDRIKDKTTTTLLADTIKSLSDHAVDTTLVLVGVAESVDTLIAEHESVQRALIQVHMPRMSQAEIDAIIDNGLAAVGMSIEQNAKQRIYKLSQGLPHYAHLLGMHSAQTAVAQDRLHIIIDDTHQALQKALEHAQQSIALDYERATLSTRGTLHRNKFLLACALANTDAHGYFTAADVITPSRKIMGKDYPLSLFSLYLNSFCESDRGPALHRTGAVLRYRYKFKNAIMQPYVIMNGVETGLISDEVMTELMSSAAVVTTAVAAAPIPATIKMLNGPSTGKTLELTKDLTTLGRPGVQVAVITRRLQDYFITHVEGASFPLVNGKVLDAQAYPLKDHDMIELTGVKMEFLIKTI